MTETTLTDRYLAAVSRAVPEDLRADITEELRASIADQIDARIEAGEPSDAAEHAVLTELGDPAVLASGYSGRPLALIGPRYYLAWRRLLITLLVTVVPIVAVVSVLVRAATGTPGGQLVGVGVTSILMVGVQVSFWSTLAFAALERTGARSPLASWTPERLPVPRQTGAGAVDAIATVVAIVLGIGAVLWDRFIGYIQLDGVAVPILSEQPWVSAAVIAALVASAIAPLLAYRRGGWTPGVAVVGAVLALIVGIALIALVASGIIVSQAFATELASVGVAQTVTTIAVVVLAAGTVWAVIDMLFKGRAKR